MLQSFNHVDTYAEILPDDVSLDGDTLAIGGCSVAELADRFGTPLYVYDAATLRNAARRARAALSPLGARISFAAKACSTIAVLRIFEGEGLDLDVVSAGELAAGLAAGFAPERIQVHGNYKTDVELIEAIRRRVRSIVIDSCDEVCRLQTIADRLDATLPVMVRVALPLQPDTHPHLQTSGNRSKFGIQRHSEEEAEAFQRLRRSSRLRLVGLHAHLGSQISDLPTYECAAQQLLTLAADLSRGGFPVEEVNVGGGWAVAYRAGDPSLSAEQVAATIGRAFRSHPGFRPAVEPGRALVARAAVAVYRVGPIKRFGTLRVIAVDGGMGDNPRPALYGASYTCFPANKVTGKPVGPAQVVGRYCETGDTLVHEAQLPTVAPGDLICIPVSGAYHLTLASAYNLVPQPAVVLVEDGSARLITRRATIDDLLDREIGRGEKSRRPGTD